ncbi:MAG: hypothetical protein WD886_07685 [Burkholderiales bacterium]
MRIHIGLKSALAGAALVTSACALLEPQVEKYSPPPVGTTYERDIRATGSFGKSYRESSKYVGMRQVMGQPMHVHERSTGQNSMLAAEGAWVGQFKGDAPIFTFDPPHGMGYPMKVGKTASQDVRMTLHAQNRVIPFKASWKVEAYEDVTVPAGTFKVFRIAYQDTNGTEGTWWVNPENGIFVKWSARRTDKHPQGPGTQDAELLKVNLPR